MIEGLGFGSGSRLALFAALTSLVAISPTGKEATDPIVLGLCRGLLIAIVLIGFFTAEKDPDQRIRPSFLVAGAGLVALMLVSVLAAAGDHFEGYYSFYRLTLFLAAFVALGRLQRETPIGFKRAVLFMVVAIDLGYLAAALARDRLPLVSTFVNPNYFASFLLPGLGVCLAYGFFGAGRRNRLLGLCAAVCLYYGIIRTSSRGATLAAVAMLCLAGFRFGRRRQHLMIGVALAGVAAGAGALALSPGLAGKFLDFGAHDPYNYGRPKIWLGALKMIAAHPVLGVGPGEYYYFARMFSTPVEGGVARYGRFANIAHSEYLQFMAENGIPAALLMFAMAGLLFRNAWRRAGGGPGRVFQEAALLVAAGLGAHALVDNNWSVPVMAAGMAVIGQADLLPFRVRQSRFSGPDRFWTPAKRVVLGALILGVLAQSLAVPAAGLYFNEAGHKAYASGIFERAELMHSMAVGIVPGHPVFLDNLGMVYFDEFVKTRDPQYLDRAESFFRRAMASNPHFEDAASHLERVLIEKLSGDLQADQSIHAAIIETNRYRLIANPFNPFNRKNLAEALYNTGAKEDAIRELLRAVEIEPNYVPGYLRLALWLAMQGQEEESRKYQNQAIARITRYRDYPATELYEALLLGRPDPEKRQ